MSNPTTIIYEHPLNERIRIFLRLEHLFQRAENHLQGDSVWSSRSVMSGLLDILAVFGRTDLKTELIKELDRHNTNLSRMRQNPNVDQKRLGGVLDEIETLTSRLHDFKGQFGMQLRQNELLAAVMQRSTIAGGTCAFDLPAYHHWLSGAPQQRKQDLQSWLESFAMVERATSLILHLIRSSATKTREVAQDGFFQRSLDPSMPVQLIRVTLPDPTPYFAEVSGGKHRFTVRFFTLETNGHNQQIEQDISFGLSCCVI